MPQVEVFDRPLLRRRRDRAAENIHRHDFLLAEIADRLMGRLSAVRKALPLIVDLSSAHGVLTERLRQRAGTETVISMDISLPMAERAGGIAVVAEEELLPFRAASLDAVVSNLNLQWVNDLPGALLQIRQALRPEGVFLGALVGGNSLQELRQCLMEAELSVTGGASPRVSPFADGRDIGVLMQRAGFALPVVDSDTVVVRYTHALKLMQDLRGMGASNATYNRLTRLTRRSVLMEAARLYHEKFTGDDGHVPATFEIIYMIGWTP